MATGCTEPIALAYAAARLRELLGAVPEYIHAQVSGNIIKNVKGVVIPNTGGLKGIPAAVAAGVIGGDFNKGLQVIAQIPPALYGNIATYLEKTVIEVSCSHTARLLDIRLTGKVGEHTALVHIANSHSNVVREERDGKVLLEKTFTDSSEDSFTNKSLLNMANIWEFANTVDLSLVEDLLNRQLSYNTAIAQEGLRSEWGSNVGSILLAEAPEDWQTEAKAWAAAGSDARMGGCEMPVVILSGSGNQGIAASVPVARCAIHLGAAREKLYRALIVSDLVTMEQKNGIGRLSAYCGAISAGVGAGAGIAYLMDGTLDAIVHTVVNAVAVLSGTICDGAKPSCAAKIAASVATGILGYQMYKSGQEFKNGEGIVAKDADSTIRNVGILAKEGMRQTDDIILTLMT